MVVSSHALGYAKGSGLPVDLNPALLGGVDIFFVISGVVMWISTCERETSPAAFYWARFTRIVPLYWLVTSTLVACMLIAPALMHTGRFNFGHVIASYAFIAWPHPTTHLMFPVLIPGWSLNYEMVFYLAFGLLLMLPTRVRLPWLVACGLGLCGLRLLWDNPGQIARFYTDPIILEFVAGACLGAWLMPKREQSAFVSLALLGTGGILCLTIPLWLGPSLPRVLLNGLPALILVGGAVCSERVIGSGRLKLLGSLGDASYAIYLIHPIVLAALDHAWEVLHLDPSQHRPLFFTCVFATVAGAGLLLHVAVERPLMRLARRLRRGPASSPLSRIAHARGAFEESGGARRGEAVRATTASAGRDAAEIDGETRRKTRISVVVCTFERPILLDLTLRSLLAVEGAEGADFDIVVVDNSDTGSAKAVVERIATGCAVPVRYVEAHPPNISLARNAGVAATQAEVVAFLDDDQEVEAGWLVAVLDGLARFPHDVFFGPITPRFEIPDAVGAHATALFTRHIAEPAGAEVVAFGRHDGPRFALATANSIFRRVGTLDGPAPFDEGFGHAGGEDYHLFCRLQRRGRRFAWLPAARATDFVPGHRCDLAYLERRHFSGGQVYAASLVRTSPTPRLTAATIVIKAAVQAAVVIGRSLALSAARRRDTDGTAFRLASAKGKLSWGRLYPLYRWESASLSRPGPPPERSLPR